MNEQNELDWQRRRLSSQRAQRSWDAAQRSDYENVCVCFHPVQSSMAASPTTPALNHGFRFCAYSISICFEAMQAMQAAAAAPCCCPPAAPAAAVLLLPLYCCCPYCQRCLYRSCYWDTEPRDANRQVCAVADRDDFTPQHRRWIIK